VNPLGLIANLVLVAGLAVIGAWYLRRVSMLRQTAPRVPHPQWRVVSFIFGLVVMAIVLLPPVDWLTTQAMWSHFAGILLVSMVAAPALVLGAPVLLTFRTASPAGRRRLHRILRNPFTNRLTYPIVTWVLFAAVTYLWQFSGMAAWAAQWLIVRDAQNLSLLAVGYLFWLPAIGLEPVRWTPMYPIRIVYIISEMVHKSFFAAAFLSLDEPIVEYFANNSASWAPDPRTDQTIAIIIASLGGNLIFLLACVWLVREWLRSESRAANRLDRRLARDRAAERERKAALAQVFERSPTQKAPDPPAGRR
jgi:putative copper resistance protein D